MKNQIYGYIYKQIHVNIRYETRLFSGNNKTTLRISEDIIKQLKHLAIDENKTLTQVIQEALTEYVETAQGK